jgi:hypothetical protein
MHFAALATIAEPAPSGAGIPAAVGSQTLDRITPGCSPARLGLVESVFLARDLKSAQKTSIPHF